MDDDITTLVIDNGTDCMKVGFAGDDSPRSIFPTTVYLVSYGLNVCGFSENTRCCIGEPQLNDGPRKGTVKELRYPIERGVVTNWDDMERVWHHTFYNGLRGAPEECIVLLSEGPLNTKANKEKTTQIMVETFNIPCFHQCMTSLLSLYASGRHTGLVIDSGGGVSHVVPIFKYHVCTRAIQSNDITGRTMTEYLTRLLCDRGYSFTTATDLELVRDIKEKLCYVLHNTDSLSTDKKHYELPDGRVITVGNERYRCTEAIFRPSLIGNSCMGLQDLVYGAVMKCDIDLRHYLLKSILLSGSNTMFSGMRERVRLQVACLVDTDVKVTAPPDRKLSCWVGGSILASLSDFYKICILREEYDEIGPSIVHRKCWYS